MSKKKRKRSVPKTGPVWHQSAEEATLAGKPRYNGFACGHGVHGATKYDRAKAKRAWERSMRQEGASRGPFLVGGTLRLRIGSEAFGAACSDRRRREKGPVV